MNNIVLNGGFWVFPENVSMSHTQRWEISLTLMIFKIKVRSLKSDLQYRNLIVILKTYFKMNFKWIEIKTVNYFQIIVLFIPYYSDYTGFGIDSYAQKTT